MTNHPSCDHDIFPLPEVCCDTLPELQTVMVIRNETIQRMFGKRANAGNTTLFIKNGHAWIKYFEQAKRVGDNEIHYYQKAIEP